MTFNSLQYLIFFPIVALLHFVIPTKYRWIMLLVASYLFYMSWNPNLVFLIAFTTIVSYAAARLMERTENPKAKKAYLTVTLAACLGVLFFYKYFNFLSGTVTGLLRLFRLPVQDYFLDLILPVGISFYTFQTLSYVIDVYRGTIPAERHFGYYALFVSFFPQLVAGPIERPQNLLPQLKAEHRFSSDDLRAGLKIALGGFFKKVVIADQLASCVVAVYSNPEAAAAPAIVIATVMFTFQVYCDFSGYTDIAVGCARIMGIRLMQNFDRPYMSRTISEFWTRWHISLTSWFQDYVFFPLATNKKISRWARKLGKKYDNRRIGVMLPQFIALFVTFFLSGLWHGAAWTFVLWGCLHGIYQIIGKLTEKSRIGLCERLHIDRESKLWHGVQIFVVFWLGVFALIFFRANSVHDLGILLGNLFTNWRFVGVLDTLQIDEVGILTAIASIAAMSLVDRLLVQGYRLRPMGEGGTLLRVETAGFLLMAIVVSWLMLMAGDGAAAFIYFQF